MDRLGAQRPQVTTLPGRAAARLLGPLAVLVLACGCTGDGSEEEPEAGPSTELTDITVSCDEFDETARRITDAQAAIYDGKESPDDAEAVDALVAELDALKEDAPEDVQQALTDLGEGFRSAQRLLEEPTAAARRELSELAPALAEDSQVVTTWIVDQCGQ